MSYARLKSVTPSVAIVAALLATCATLSVQSFAADRDDFHSESPIKHVVVIFQENVSFDHYFGTYPFAANSDGQPFHAAKNTPSVNGLNIGLLTHNPNSVQPFRLSSSQNYTCDQNHDYTPEQEAFDGGLMDMFVEKLGVGGGGCDHGLGTALVMGYYDGNTVTALWNYAQHFSLNDNSYNTTFGPSTPGAINLVSGQTNGIDLAHTIGDISGDVAGNSVIGDPDPFYDDCGSPEQLAVTGTNIGDEMTTKGLTWGWFQGGFRPTSRTAGGKAVCGLTTVRVDGTMQKAYSAHHEPFQYYASTSNPHHLPPSSIFMIGRTDQANHQYDIEDFWDAAFSGNLPAVSFLKAPRGQDGHASNSSPLDEQVFIVDTLNRLQSLNEWGETAVFIAYDDSDGWYDHQMGPIMSQSQTAADALTGTGLCGSSAAKVLGGKQGRCGYGPRLPLLVISPYARKNFVDSTLTDQTSILRFIEDNFDLSRISQDSFDNLAGTVTNMFNFKHRRRDLVFLDPSSGQVLAVEGDR